MDNVLQIVTVLVTTVLAPLAAWFIKQKITNEKIQRAVLLVNEAVATAVSSASQTYVTEIKKAKADGTLSDDEKKKAKELALHIAVKHLGDSGMALVNQVFGNAETTPESVIADKIEAAVADSKNP